MSQSFQISDDLRELLASLSSHNVDFVIVGGYAMAHHGVVRFTEDVDLLVRRSRENLQRLAECLRSFGIQVPDEAIEQFLRSDRALFHIGVAPNRVDFLNFLSGLDSNEPFKAHETITFGGQEFPVLTFDQLVKNKTTSNRSKDQLDIARLKELWPERFSDS